MNNPLRTKLIRKNLLEALNFAEGYPVTDGALRSHVDALVRPPVTDAEWEEHIQWLLEVKAIAKVEARFDASLVQYTITEKGAAMLASL